MLKKNLKSYILSSRTTKIISSDPSCKDGNAQFTTVPLKPKSDKNFGRYRQKVFLSVRFSIRSDFCRETPKENKQFKETKSMISNPHLIRQRFQGYCCKSCIVIFA